MSLVSTTSGKIVFVHLHTVKLHPGALHESKSIITLNLYPTIIIGT